MAAAPALERRARPRGAGIAAGCLMLLLALLLRAVPAAAQAPALAPPPLAAELSTNRIEVTTAFTGGEILVFGATEQLIHPGGDEIVVLASGPETSLVVRRKINVLGIWINGPSARFNNIPSYWSLAATRPVAEMLGQAERAELRLGLDLLQLPQLGARGPEFRAALRALKQGSGQWSDQARPVEIAGGRLFHARLAVPSTVATGDYQVQVMLVRQGRVVARQELGLQVARVGTAAEIADVAQYWPVLYALASILLAAFAGWLGSVLFREELMSEAQAAAQARRDRVFLVVVDDSPERRVALRYACLRARNSGGRVALLRVIEPAGQVEWAGVGAMLAEERREEAEKLLSALAAEVNELTGGLPILLIREGDPQKELLALLEEDPRISILVLAAAGGGGGPGPLISLLAGRHAGKLPVPMTIVPGDISDDALERLT